MTTIYLSLTFNTGDGCIVVDKKGNVMENKLRISKSKSLVEASYRLTLDEKRLVQYAITKVNPFKYYSGEAYCFNVLDFARCYKLNEKNCYRYANEALDQLFSRILTYWDDAKEMNVTCRLIINKFDDKKGVLGVRFSDEMHKMLINDKDFLSYAIKHTVAFTSPSSMRIYEILLYQLQRSPIKRLVKKFNISEIKETLGLGDKYNRFADFKIRVLDPAKEQINKHSDIQISYAVIKAGRTPTHIKFTAKYKTSEDQNGNIEDQKEIDFDPGEQPVTKTESSDAKKILANAKLGIF